MSKTKELTNALLKEKMTDAIVRRAATDFDICLTPGHYVVNAEQWVNHPKGSYRYGTLLVYGNPDGFLTQVYIPHANAYICWRTYYKSYNSSTGHWDSWKKVTGETLV